jgi:hypothetical protein
MQSIVNTPPSPFLAPPMTPAIAPVFARALSGALGPRRYRVLRQLQWAATEEFRDSRYGWRDKFSAWRRGFLVENAIVYGFPRADWRDYVNDYLRGNQGADINPIPQFFDHKLMLRALLLQHGFPQAGTFALIGNALLGKADAQLDPLGPQPRLVSLSALEEAMRAHGGPFIVKPQDSGYGYHVSLVEARGEGLVRRRGLKVTRYRVRPSATTTLVEHVIPQHPFWRELYPDSGNSMRILTLWTPGTPAPFIAAAAQRIGASDTAPTDNFQGGGIGAPIELDTGTLRRAVRRSPQGQRQELTHHPETGVRIEGARLPYWESICETTLRAATVLGIARYVGWDVMVDVDGRPIIIEGNANSGVRVLQLESGLLKNPAVRHFYEALGAR